MVYLFYGENTFAAKDQVRKLAKRYEGSTGSNYGLHWFESDSDSTQVLTALTAQPMFADSSLVVVENPSQNKELQTKILANIDQIPSSTVVVLVDPNIDKRTKWFKTLQQQAKLKEFKPKSDAQLLAWLQQQSKAEGLELSPELARLLLDRVGSDQWRLSQEVAKLASRSDLTVELIESLVLPSPRHTIFELLEVLARGDTETALRYWDDLRAQGVHVLEILTMISWQLRNLIVIASCREHSDTAIARDHGLNPYVVSKSKATAKRIPLEALIAAYQQVIQADYELKTGRSTDPEGLIERVIFYIADVSRPRSRN
ncbi:MAG: DNA polymerase III subunit delta [Candidatus Saccharimonadales bacterium]